MKKFFMILSCALIGTMAVQAQSDKRIPAKGFAVSTSHGNFQPYEFSRHAVGDNDILIEILYAGICHSDIHTAHGDWGEVNYPFVPGHEIAGRVVSVGKNVTKFKKGDYAGVGCLVNACLQCNECKAGYEQDCANRVLTYAADDIYHDHEMTQGGYSDKITVSEDFAIKIPANADMSKVAPLLCAGITTYAPISLSKVKRGDKVAVAGFGGLGHLAVKYLVKLGAEVTVFDVTDDKRQAALSMGAVRYINVKHPEELRGTDNSFSFLLSTVPVGYNMSHYLRMVKKGGDMAIVGLPSHAQMPAIDVNSLIHLQHRNIYGSMIGGIRQTQEMLDYSVANGIYPDVQIIEADGNAIDNAYRNVQDGKVQFRYVIDMSTMK